MPNKGKARKEWKPRRKQLLILTPTQAYCMYYILLQTFLTKSPHMDQMIPVEWHGSALANLLISVLLDFPFSWHVKPFEIIWSFLLLQDLQGPKASDSEDS